MGSIRIIIMMTMIIGYILAVITGISLGLLGGRGSILTVPILVYALGMEPKVSIAMSLGITVIFGSIAHFKAKKSI